MDAAPSMAPEDDLRGSSSKHLQSVYDKKQAALQAKMPWYKNSSQDVDIAGFSPAPLVNSTDKPSMDFIQGKNSQHTAMVSLFPELDEALLQATLAKPSRQSTTPTNSPSKTQQSPDRKRDPNDIKWRGRVSWESDLLEPAGANTPSKRSQQSPLKNVMPSMVPTAPSDEARAGSSNPPSHPKRSSAVSLAEKEDEIDALLSKFKICADARSGIRDNLLSKYTPQAPHTYVFTSPDVTYTEADPDAASRVSSPSVPERRMRDVKKALAHEGGDSSSDEEPDEDADVAHQMKDSYFGVGARGKFFAKYAGLHAKPHCFMAVPHTRSLHLPSPEKHQHHHRSPSNSPPKGRDRSAPDDDATPPPTSPDKAGGDATIASVSQYDYLPPVGKPVSPRRSTQTRVTNENDVKMSPRTMFLSACLSNTGNLPMALPILIRKHGTTAFDFSYQSLGDAFLVEFARALRDVPFVESINVCDNRLSDRALNQLLQALETKPNLTKLDISMNQVGARSAKTLKAYIGSPMCTLTHLGVCKADIDDSECAAFMVAFEANKSVIQLRMSRNRIGEAENLNVVQPDFVTGGEAIGGMLNVNLTLTQLDVSWNLLRLASGVTLANSLKLNYNLFELNLAYNALGDAGAMAFGQSLCINKTLRLLDMSYNNIGTKGASVLASTVSRSRTITTLVLDGNNIGQPGGKVLMYAMVHNRTPNGCTVSMKGCNLNERTQTKVFDPMEPGGDYVLDCTDPYDNMVATELLRLATVKKGCSFTKLEAKPTRDAPKKLTQTVKLVRREVSRPVPAKGATKTLLDLTFHDMDSKAVGSITLTELHGVLLELGFQPTLEQTDILFNKIDTDGSGTIDEAELSGGGLFHAVFRTIDANESGTIDMDELRQAFVILGARATEEDVEAAMNAYDVDGSGTIEEDEFVELMKNQVIQRANQHQAEQSVEALALRDESTGAVWAVPTTGFLDVSFVYERELMNDRESFVCYGLSEHGLKKLVQSVERGKETMQQAELLNVAVHETEIRMTAAQAIVLMESCGDMHETKRVAAVAKVLPQLTSIKEAQLLVKRVLTTSERFSLRLRLGALYFPLLGLPTNHYVLDLSRQQDRQALVKLAEIAQAEKQFSKSRSGRGDTSQHGNWENFRNEWLDGKPAILTSHFFQTMPQKGKLEFDYVSTSRPTRGTKPMSDRRYQQLLAQIARDSRTELRLSEKPSSGRRRSVGGRWELVRNAIRFRKFKKWIRDVKMAFQVHSHTKEDIGYKLFQIEAATCDRWLSVDQAAEIVRCMPSAHGGKTETCRLLFPRLIDIENFMEIFDALSFPEKNECARVLGWLNILNPQHPDRYYAFDLSIREEREAAKIFVKLAVSEPGENWINESFGWVRGEPPIPGWELPKSWANDDVTAEDGPRRTGWLTFEYTSDPARGCGPVPAVRQELMLRVLCGTRLYL